MEELTAETDTEKTDYTIESVIPDADTFYTINTTEHMSFGMEAKYGIEPKAGDTVTVYGSFGRPIRGVAINGEVVFYRSPGVEEQQRIVTNAINRARKIQAFDYDVDGVRTKLDADYAALPDVFKDRIDKFRGTNNDFRWDFEGYEMMVCVDAVKVADWLRSKVGDNTDADTVRQTLADITSEEEKAIPIDGGHSGNSWGFTQRLAFLYVTEPEGVVYEHGALVPLVGCDDYGCPHVERDAS